MLRSISSYGSSVVTEVVMPVSPEHLSALRAYERLWRSDASDADVEAVFASGFTDHRPGASGAGVEEFREHRTAALGALKGLSARYEPVAGDGHRLAAHATVTGVHSGEFFGVAPTGKTLSWREVHLFEVRDGRIAGHWMDAALLSAYLQMTGPGQPDAEPARAVPSGLARSYTAAEQQAPLDAYTAMVAGHDASAARKLYTGDYLQHGPFGPNVTRSEFEAGNRDIVWKAMPDISIQLTPFLADGELVAYRGLGQGTHTGAALLGVPPAGRHVSFTETHIVRLRGTGSASTGCRSTCSACSPS
jgi:predicted ester cyclase